METVLVALVITLLSALVLQTLYSYGLRKDINRLEEECDGYEIDIRNIWTAMERQESDLKQQLREFEHEQSAKWWKLEYDREYYKDKKKDK
jgi:hypothetical protein